MEALGLRALGNHGSLSLVLKTWRDNREQACEVLSAVQSRRTFVKLFSNAYVYGPRSGRRSSAIAAFEVRRVEKIVADESE